MATVGISDHRLGAVRFEECRRTNCRIPPWRKYAAAAGVSIRTVAVNSVPSPFLSARTVSLRQHRDDAEQFGALAAQSRDEAQPYSLPVRTMSGTCSLPVGLRGVGVVDA